MIQPMLRQRTRPRVFSPKLLSHLFLYLLMIFVAILMALPFIWQISSALKTSKQITEWPPRFIPDPVVWRNFYEAWTALPFGRLYLNSIFVAVVVVVGQLFNSSLGAYAFARLRFPGRDKLFLSYLITIMLPFEGTVIPLYIVMSKLHWVDTYQALIVPFLFSAYSTFLLRQFFATIPYELSDAARVDGASEFTIFTRIILPLSKPILATAGAFIFIGIWNSFLWPLIVTNTREMGTVPVGISLFRGAYFWQWHLMMAATAIATIPTIIVYLFTQRFFIKSIALTGLK